MGAAALPVRLLACGARLLLRLIGRIVFESAIGRAFEILELPGFERPYETRKPQAAKKQSGRDQPEKRGHAVSSSLAVLSRIAFSVTRIDDVDIAMAATRGVTNPAMARGTKMRL